MSQTDASVARPVVASDLDGTFYREQFLYLIMIVFLRRGIFPGRLKKPFRELKRLKRDRHISYHEYDQRLIALFMEGIEGADVQRVERASKYIARYYGEYVYTFTRALLQRLEPTHDLIAITGANEHVVRHIAPFWHFAKFYSTEFEIKDGQFTARESALPVVDKGRALREHIATCGGTLKGSVAIGDSQSDAPMLDLVDHPIAFNPDDNLAPIAEKNGWPVVVERRNLYVYRTDGTFRRFPLSRVNEAVDYVLDLPR